MASAGDEIGAERAAWSFGGEVAKAFDQHVGKSVPLYAEGHDLVAALSDFHVGAGSVVYELGCSTGTLSLALAERHKRKAGARFIGLDTEAGMIEEANRKREATGLPNVSFSVADICGARFEPADLIVAYYTVQFVRPAVRQELVDRVFSALRWGGAFVMFEKVRGPDARFQDVFSLLYNYDFKRAQGYSPDEIVAKTQSLRGVMEPFSTAGNLEMLGRAGFQDVATVMKFICFEGFVSIK